MLSYNGYPFPTELRDRYPNAPADVLHEAVKDLWIDRLAYASGKTDTNSFDPDAIYHRISCLAGASGAPLINANGEMIGKFLLHLDLSLSRPPNPATSSFSRTVTMWRSPWMHPKSGVFLKTLSRLSCRKMSGLVG